MEKNKKEEYEEIDLSKISYFFSSVKNKITNSFYKLLHQIIKNKKPILILFIIGLLVGFYIDKKNKTYNNELIVITNFGCTDYVYSKIEKIQTLKSENDSLLLSNNISFAKKNNLINIEIEPINDLFRFIEFNQNNFELVKVIAESNANIEKISSEKTISKNYPFHKIIIKTNKKVNDKDLTEPLLNFLNDSDYYRDIHKVYNLNIKTKIAQNDSIINQIDKILNQFSAASSVTKNSNLVYYNENTQLNDILKNKEDLIRENGRLRIELVNIKNIVTKQTSILNKLDKSGLNNKLKYLFPIVFVLLFILISSFIKTYKQKTQNL